MNDPFPLTEALVVLLVKDTFSDLRHTSFGAQNIVPKWTGQAVGSMFEPLFLYRLQRIQPFTWRGGKQKSEKDVVHLGTPSLSFEIKTSSSKNKIVGNKSSTKEGKVKHKDRDGYLLAVNYDISSLEPMLIRVGTLTDDDWSGQKSETGQCAVVRNSTNMTTIFSS
jgi:hypothetical protein